MSIHFLINRVARMDDPITYCIERYKITGKKFWYRLALQFGADDDRTDKDWSDNNPYDRQ